MAEIRSKAASVAPSMADTRSMAASELPTTRSEVSTAGACVWARSAVQGCRGAGKWRYMCLCARCVRDRVCGLGVGAR